MKTEIRPALTPAEWRSGRAVRVDGTAQWPIEILKDGTFEITVTRDLTFTATKPETLTALIALANSALPDSDPRKITPMIAEAIEDLANFDETALAAALRMPVTDSTVEALRRFAAGLRSLLPPEH